MKLTVLGGAAACPNPGQGCSAYLVDSGTVRILLDCGPDTLSVLRQHVDYHRLDAVVISHLHADHTLDLVPFRYGLKYGPGRTGAPIPLWLPPDGRAFLERLAGALAAGGETAAGFFDDVFEVSEYDPSRSYEVGPVTIRFHATRHAIPCWAARLEADAQVLVYLADTAPSPDLARFARGADLLVCEGTMPESEGTDANSQAVHLTARQAGEIASAAGAKRLLLTHLWAELGFEHLRAQAESSFAGEVTLSQPGLIADCGAPAH